MIVKKSLVEQVYSYVVSGIQTREYKPGDRLVIEELAKKLGVSRTPIREAIGKLAQDGFVFIEHNIGPKIIEYNKTQIRDLSETNGILFHGVLYRVFKEADVDILLAKLKKIVKRQEKALVENDDDGYHKSSVEFHKELIKACPNEKLKQIALQTQAQIDIFVLWYFQDEDIKRTSVIDHKRLLQLMDKGRYDEFILEFDKHNEMALEYFEKRDEEIALSKTVSA